MHIADYHAIPDTDEKFRLPKGDYGERLYRIDDPPADFRQLFRFTLPGETVVDERSVLAYMVDPDSNGNMKYEIWANNRKVVSGHMIGGVVRGLWEIIGGGIWLANQENTIEFRALPDKDSRGHLSFSDVIVWFQRNVPTA